MKLKTFKKVIFITYAIGCFLAAGKFDHDVYAGQYPAVGIVTSISEREMTITDAAGNNWRYITKREDWFLNDLAAMIMDDNGTPIIYDDKIVGEPRYVGVIRFFQEFEIPEEE